MQRQIEAVEQVLAEIGAGSLPMIIALNKSDLLPPNVLPALQGLAARLPVISVSAAQGTHTEALLNCISETLVQQFVTLDVVIPYDRGDLVAQFHRFGSIESEEYEPHGTHLRGHMPANHSGPFSTFRQAPPRKKARA